MQPLQATFQWNITCGSVGSRKTRQKGQFEASDTNLMQPLPAKGTLERSATQNGSIRGQRSNSKLFDRGQLMVMRE